MSVHRIAVIGDIHANLRALDAALKKVSLQGADELIFLGDLLTYGVDVVAVIERVAMACRLGRVTLLRGNHDTMYLSASGGGNHDYESTLPDWLVETIAFTRARVPKAAFDALPFEDSYRSHDVLFAHANPFGGNNWSYINSDSDHVTACEVLRSRNFLYGVFGHTHRPKIFCSTKGIFLNVTAGIQSLPAKGGPYILNAGSIGQPRTNNSCSVYTLFLNLSKGGVQADFQPINYSVAEHISALQSSGMSASTIEKLVGFFPK